MQAVPGRLGRTESRAFKSEYGRPAHRLFVSLRSKRLSAFAGEPGRANCVQSDFSLQTHLGRKHM